MNFTDFDFTNDVLDGLASMGFEKCTPVQEFAIPVILEGKDLIACAQTGTGKTAAYLLPILNNISREGHTGMHTLIIAPTRELVLQIDQQIEGFSYFTGASSLAAYGGGVGAAFDQQKSALVQGADIIVATPGRLLSHINMKYSDFSTIQTLILDEADRMLDMGFFDDIMRIVGELPVVRQTLLFSATMPPKIRQMAGMILRNPEQINIAISKPAENIIQAAYMVYEGQKVQLLKELLKGKTDYKSVLIFTSRKANVNGLVRELRRMGFSADGMLSDLEQKEREEVMLRFRNRETQILVATDIVSRGIDIDSIDLVMNYDVPRDPEDYVHRIGRTARASQSGVAITLISDNDMHDFKKIEELIEREIIKIPLPAGMGIGPEYNPAIRRKGPMRSSSGGRRDGGNRTAPAKKEFRHRDRGNHQGHRKQGE
ncbi:MAG TPA: DEAD/DEAH box helicase [Prolixibacteraceae bacterium]|nr:DEAD/DEAH box helicase [Prolixibacteraceae bacterium]